MHLSRGFYLTLNSLLESECAVTCIPTGGFRTIDDETLPTLREADHDAGISWVAGSALVVRH